MWNEWGIERRNKWIIWSIDEVKNRRYGKGEKECKFDDRNWWNGREEDRKMIR